MLPPQASLDNSLKLSSKQPSNKQINSNNTSYRVERFRFDRLEAQNLVLSQQKPKVVSVKFGNQHSKWEKGHMEWVQSKVYGLQTTMLTHWLAVVVRRRWGCFEFSTVLKVQFHAQKPPKSVHFIDCSGKFRPTINFSPPDKPKNATFDHQHKLLARYELLALSTCYVRVNNFWKLNFWRGMNISEYQL